MLIECRDAVLSLKRYRPLESLNLVNFLIDGSTKRSLIERHSEDSQRLETTFENIDRFTFSEPEFVRTASRVSAANFWAPGNASNPIAVF